MKNLKYKKLLFGIPLILISFEIFTGMLIGYLIARFSSGEEGYPGRIKSIVFNIGNRKAHLHHWLIALIFMPMIIAYNFLPFPKLFATGFLGGLIFQGITSFNDWYRILTKQKKQA